MKPHHSVITILLREGLVSKAIASNLFPFEIVQLQKIDLVTLPPRYANLLAFSTPSPSGTVKCKVFPGDAVWPSD